MSEQEHYIYGVGAQGRIHLIDFDDARNTPNPRALCGKRGSLGFPLQQGGETTSCSRADCRRCLQIAKAQP